MQCLIPYCHSGEEYKITRKSFRVLANYINFIPPTRHPYVPTALHSSLQTITTTPSYPPPNSRTILQETRYIPPQTPSIPSHTPIQPTRYIPPQTPYIPSHTPIQPARYIPPQTPYIPYHTPIQPTPFITPQLDPTSRRDRPAESLPSDPLLPYIRSTSAPEPDSSSLSAYIFPLLLLTFLGAAFYWGH